MIAMDELLTTEDVARILQYTPYTVREMCKRGEIKAKKFGRNWRVKQEDLQDYIDKQPEVGTDKK